MNQKTDDIYRYALQRLNAYIDEHCMRHTREREFVLQKVCVLRCFSVEQLRAECVDMVVSRATLYNTLALFVRAGILHRLNKEFGVRAGQYEIVQAQHSHIQIVCTRCGRVSEVRDPGINRILADKRFTNFTGKQFSLYIYGNCKVCRRKPIIQTLNQL